MRLFINLHKVRNPPHSGGRNAPSFKDVLPRQNQSCDRTGRTDRTILMVISLPSHRYIYLRPARTGTSRTTER